MNDIEKAYLKTLTKNLKSAIWKGDWQSAQSALERLQQSAPLAIETRGFQLELLIKQKQWQQAQPLLEQLMALFGQSPRIHFLAGQLHYQLREYNKAILAFRESHNYYPHWKTQRWLGKSFTQLGELDEAESILLSVKNKSSQVLLDLAWLHERRKNPQTALPFIEDYLSRHPDNEFAKTQQLRLYSQITDSQVLIDDVETLLELDETIPDEVLPDYISRLLETGRSAKVRSYVELHQTEFSHKLSSQLGWICHKYQAHDLVLRLFMVVIEDHLGDFKLLNCLESAAKHCQQIGSLVERYEQLAEQHKPLYGRIKRLNKLA